MKILVHLALVVAIFLNHGTCSLAHIATKDVGWQLPVLKPEPHHAAASQQITERFTRLHYRQFKLDSLFSAQIFERYLSLLDYHHHLLLAAEIEQFSILRAQLGHALSLGQLEGAYALYNLVQQRRLQRYHAALELLKQPMIFDNDETFSTDRRKAPWPKTVQQRDQLWYSQVKFDALNLKLTGKSWSQIASTLTKRYQTAIKQLGQTKSEDVFFTVMNALAREIDPHTSYLLPRHAEQFKSDISLSLEGIGALLKTVDDYTVIHALIPGGPAANSKAIVIDDRIIGVGQAGKKIVDIIGWRLDDVVDLIKGPRGTKVCLEILPSSKGSKPKQVWLTRDRIRLEDRAIKASIKNVGPCKLGILEIPSFYLGLSEEVKQKLLWFNQQQVSNIIIDLRGNGGGALTEAVALTGLFIPAGPVVQIRSRTGRISVNCNGEHRAYYKGAITILVDRLSASASEIFAAALQDYGRALVVGEQTFGKGTVQQHHIVNPYYNNANTAFGYIQYTIQKFYRINGDSTQLKGVIPEIIMLPGLYTAEIGERFEDNVLPWDRIDAVNFSLHGDLKPYLNTLRQRHNVRIAANQEFHFIKQNTEYYKLLREKGYVSLNLIKRQQESQQEEAMLLQQINQRRAKQGQKVLNSIENLPKDEKKIDPYLEETIAIALDFLELQQQKLENRN